MRVEVVLNPWDASEVRFSFEDYSEDRFSFEDYLEGGEESLNLLD